MKRFGILLCSLLLIPLAIMLTGCSSGPGAPQRPSVDEEAFADAIKTIEAKDLTQKQIDSIVEEGEGMFWALRDRAFGEDPVAEPHHYFWTLTSFDEDTYQSLLYADLNEEQALSAIRLLSKARSKTNQDYLGFSIDALLSKIEENPELRDAFFEDSELSENFRLSFYDARESKENAIGSGFNGRYVFLAIDADAMDEKMAEDLLGGSSKEFLNQVMSTVTSPEQYHIAKQAAVRLIIGDPSKLFPCVARLQDVADGTASGDFDDSGKTVIFKNFGTNTPSFTQGGSAPATECAAIAIRGSYDGSTFVPEDIYASYMNGYGMFDKENIHSMPASLDELTTYICIGVSEEQVSSYTIQGGSGREIPGMRYVVTVLKVNAISGQIYAAEAPVYGENPPEEKTVSSGAQSIVGDYPDALVKESVGNAVGLSYKK